MGSAASSNERIRCPPRLAPQRAPDDGHVTASSIAQGECEDACIPWLAVLDYGPSFWDKSDASILLTGGSGAARLAREEHVAYLLKSLQSSGRSHTLLHTSRTWKLFWSLHSLDLLHSPPLSMADGIVSLLQQCQRPTGGFGGAPHVLPHALATFAAVCAALCVGTPAAFAVIHRPAMHAFFMSLRTRAAAVCGPRAAGIGFTVHAGGELDVRSCYAVIAVAKLIGILTPSLVEGVADFLLACQTWEGGFAGEPGMEAHGGYTYCAVAALTLLGRLHDANVHALRRWLALRQMSLEGGYSGRVNKLVDGCYSFWQGACIAMLPPTDSSRVDGEEAMPPILSLSSPPCRCMTAVDVVADRVAVQMYTLLCCQCPEGGLRDKPGKPQDAYHTCYCLSGLAVAQHYGRVAETPDSSSAAAAGETACPPLHACVVGDAETNLLPRTYPEYNLCVHRVDAARAWFDAHPVVIGEDEMVE